MDSSMAERDFGGVLQGGSGVRGGGRTIQGMAAEQVVHEVVVLLVV